LEREQARQLRLSRDSLLGSQAQAFTEQASFHLRKHAICSPKEFEKFARAVGAPFREIPPCAAFSAIFNISGLVCSDGAARSKRESIGQTTATGALSKIKISFGRTERPLSRCSPRACDSLPERNTESEIPERRARCKSLNREKLTREFRRGRLPALFWRFLWIYRALPQPLTSVRACSVNLNFLNLDLSRYGHADNPRHDFFNSRIQARGIHAPDWKRCRSPKKGTTYPMLVISFESINRRVVPHFCVTDSRLARGVLIDIASFPNVSSGTPSSLPSTHRGILSS